MPGNLLVVSHRVRKALTIAVCVKVSDCVKESMMWENTEGLTGPWF